MEVMLNACGLAFSWKSWKHTNLLRSVNIKRKNLGSTLNLKRGRTWWSLDGSLLKSKCHFTYWREKEWEKGRERRGMERRRFREVVREEKKRQGLSETIQQELFHTCGLSRVSAPSSGVKKKKKRSRLSIINIDLWSTWWVDYPHFWVRKLICEARLTSDLYYAHKSTKL